MNMKYEYEMQLWLTKNNTQIRRAECYVNFNTIFECGFMLE